MKPVRIGFLLPRYSRRSTSCWPLVVKAVADLGAEVGIVHPLPGPLDLSALQVRHDLYVLRKLSGLALSLAGALHELGATILNPYPATAAVHDKIVAAGILQTAGLPIPATYCASCPEDLAPLLDAGPVVIDLYGVDIIESDGKPYVVDVSSLPGFKGVPDAPRLLAQHIYAAAERAARGHPVLPDRATVLSEALP